VPPAELEALLLQHPEVMDVGVIGVYEKSQATELPRAYVVAKPNVDISTPEAKQSFEKRVAEWVAERVAPHKKLRGGVEAIAAIPKSPSGKILRKDLRAKAQAERDAAHEARAKL
jgi:acyl-coenzyme A synthetase/AMP-(fatty) acid ligase